MSALSADKKTPRRDSVQYSYPVLAGAKIYAGAIIVLDSSGWAKPGVAAVGLKCVGIAQANVDNTNGSNGSVFVDVRPGVFRLGNGDSITKADEGKSCYISDDNTVTKGTTGKSKAGRIVDVDADGVWVDFAAQASEAKFLTLRATNLVGTTRYLMVSPIAGEITKIRSVLEGAALATGDATLTGKINGSAITNGVLTITQAGSAIGDKQTATPTAANVVAAGDTIEFLVGGTNSSANSFADIMVELTATA